MVDKVLEEKLYKATRSDFGRFCYATLHLYSTGDRPSSLSLMRLLLYQSMYSVSSEMKCSTDVNSCKYSNSVFNKPKKFSAQALSRQLPLRDILCLIPLSFSIFWYCLCWYCQPWSECRIRFVLSGILANAFSSISVVCARFGWRLKLYDTTSPLYKSMIGDRYSFIPNSANSVTSVTHFWLGLSALKSRSRRLGGASGILPAHTFS